MTSQTHNKQDYRRKGMALTGLLALAVHLAAFSLAAIMPITTALAAAEAQPFEIVICTVHGPVTIDARELGVEMDVDLSNPSNLPLFPRTACDLALQSVTAIAIDTTPLPHVIPVAYADTRVDRPAGSRPAYSATRKRASPPRAPPHTS